jgi:LuxR family maltose regulon positive regulatory protein
MKYPIVLVCAGSGYGKTSAVHDFTEESNATTAWIQLSERDNVGARFWENCANTIMQINAPFAKASIKLGFPDNCDKRLYYQTLMHDHVKMKPRIIVMDDFHFIEEPSVIRFIEECVFHNMPPGTSVFLLSRSSPRINIAGLVSKGFIFNINENDLRFTENELAQYFRQTDVFLSPQNIREIEQDTEGWAFAINLIARSYQKAPGYGGYVRNAMKNSIFALMETEIWDEISKSLQDFLIRLSLIEHLSVDLIAILAGDDQELIAELEKTNAYIRRDNYISAYLIHPLFLEFLTGKQELLSEEQKLQTYAAAGEWCNKNGFKVDALSYYEKTGDYGAIVPILNSLPSQIPRDIAKYAAEILDRAPLQAFDKVEYLATMHISACMCQGLWEKAVNLAEYYEKKFLKFAKNNPFRKHALGALYHCWGHLRILLCIKDDCYDFDQYFEKFERFFSPPLDLRKMYSYYPGPWINVTGSSRKGAPQDFIGSLTRTAAIISRCFNGLKTGEDELARGELKFYQGDLSAAETFFVRALEQTQEHRQFDVMHRVLFYILRLSIVQGNYLKSHKVLKDMKAQLEEGEYINRFVNYDIACCWYYCILGLSERTPDWLTEHFSPYCHAGFMENFANQMKAIFCYMTRNYQPLLSYIEEMKQRESYLYGRAEMLAMEACVHYKIKNKKEALAALQEAYKTASPNELIMPFIELGKDMRTLTSFALKKQTGNMPKSWLQTVNRKSASYAKQLAHIVAEYKQDHRIATISISPRENEILNDLSHGLSRTEIAVNRSLSINTVKMVINNVYMKLGARNMADAIRIAAEKKIV